MPSHLAPPSAPAGRTTGAREGGPATTTRRALRAQRAELGEVEALPGVAELMAADAALGRADGAGLVPARPPATGGGSGPVRRSWPVGASSSPVAAPAAAPGTASPAAPRVPSGPPAPTTRREARQRADAVAARVLPVLAPPAAPAPVGEVAPSWTAPVGATATSTAAAAAVAAGPPGGSRGGLALAERPAAGAPLPEAPSWSWSPGDTGAPLGFTAELDLSGLRHVPAPPPDDVIVLPPTPLVDAHGAPPAPLTRRARREIEHLERSLALPAASPARSRERHLMAVALSPEGDLASQMPVDPAPDRRSRRAAPGRSAFGLPQVGVVGVLGLAVLVGPSLGQVAHADSAPTPSPTSQPALPPTPIGEVADLPAPATSATVVPSLAPGEAMPPRAEELLAKREQAEQASRAIGERTVAAEEVARAAAEREAAAAALVPGCDGQVDATLMSAANGQLPDADLCVLWNGDERLRPDAALAMARLDLAYRDAFGEDIPVSDAYRDYGSQVEVRRTKPGLAARPGTSQHGWGVAVDLGGNIASGGDRYAWLMEHAGEFGWENPVWARPGGAGPHEPWHWEYAAGRGLVHTG